MKKKLLLIPLVLLLAVSLVPISCAAPTPTPTPTPTPAPAVIYLTLADTTAAIGLRGEGTLLLLDEIRKQTNDRVQVQVFWYNSLLKGKEILKGVQTGTVDMGYTLANYYPETLIAHQAYIVLPRGPKEYANIMEFFWTTHEESSVMTGELAAFNQKLFYANLPLPTAIACTEPLTSFDDLKGKRVRASAASKLAALEDAGATPVSVPFSDCYMALQTGMIEGVYTSMDAIHRTKLDEVGPHLLVFRGLWIEIPHTYTINFDTLNSLPEDVKEQLMEAGRVASLRCEDLYKGKYEEILAVWESPPYTLTIASPEDEEKWQSMPIVSELQTEWVKKAEAAGMQDAEGVLEGLKEAAEAAIKAEMAG